MSCAYVVEGAVISRLDVSMLDFDLLVGAIYDCAVNPELWPDTLTQLRDSVDSAYALVAYVDRSTIQFGGQPLAVRRNSEWDEDWIGKLDRMMAAIPANEKMLFGDVDTAWTQMMHSTEAEFHESPFYKSWVGPQKLRDTLNISYLQRDNLVGVLALPSRNTRELYGPEECRFIERISPHIRRATLINAMVDKGKLAITLYRQTLDLLSSPVFVLGLGRRLLFTNAAGDTMLSEGLHLTLVNETLQPQKLVGFAAAFEEAIDRALKGDVAIGISGIGVPLIAQTGERLAAYVLPIAGKDIRGEIGPGHCTVFIARRDELQPMVIEVLRTVFDLTVSEARVAAQLARGDSPQVIAENLHVSVNTVRTHLKHTYAKTDTHDQTSLSGLINSLLPPVLG
jgi:DNA-binding CsgD family transcriptional regulator